MVTLALRQHPQIEPSIEQVGSPDTSSGGWGIGLGLSARVNLLIYTLIAAMLLVYVPAARSYMQLRQTFREALLDLNQQLLLREFETRALSQTAELFDVVVFGEPQQELQAAEQTAQAMVAELTSSEGGSVRFEDVSEEYFRLQQVERKALQLARGGWVDEAFRVLRDEMVPTRDAGLLQSNDEVLSQERLVFEDRMLGLSAPLPLVPFVEIESSASRLRADAAEALAAATFLQHLQRLIAEYEDFAFLDGAWHKLYLAEGKTEKTFEQWQIEVAAAAPEPSIPSEDVRRIGGLYLKLNRTGKKLVDVSESDSREQLDAFYREEFEPLTDSELRPLLDSMTRAYEDHLASSTRSVWRRIDLAGYSMAVFGLILLALASISPWLMSRWIVQPIGALTLATRRLGTGDLSEQVTVQRTDELGELAQCFNQMVVDLKEAQNQLGRRERLVVMGQLAGSVAHEIRNPLGVMKNSIYFLRLTQKLRDEKAMQHLGLIEDEINRANRIITELLDYARDPTSQVGIFVLQDAFYKALAEVEVPDSVRIEHDLEEEPFEMTGDSGQIERVLSNFLRNAVQAMPDGGALRLECHRRGDDVVAAVTDTGVGIAEDVVDRIFEPLYTGKAKGIGLGLPLSLRYAQLNSGRIEVDSVLGEGSTFRLVLPAPRNDADPG
ncbi:MAG: HAMP domain-containing protein [bacterium]|nr:HAMP domain-containing protein [bacterium]